MGPEIALHSGTAKRSKVNVAISMIWAAGPGAFYQALEDQGRRKLVDDIVGRSELLFGDVADDHPRSSTVQQRELSVETLPGKEERFSRRLGPHPIGLPRPI